MGEVKKADYGISNTTKVVLMLSRMHWKKGVDLLIDAASEIDDVAFLIAGDGPEMEKYRADTHTLADAPTRRLLRAALLDMTDIEDYGEQVQSAYGLEETEWSRELGKVWEGELIERQFSADSRPFDGVPQRAARFPDPYNMGVNAEVFLYDKTMPVEPKTLMMYYKRLREIDVPEMMASIIAETGDQPWAYYRDMTRQLRPQGKSWRHLRRARREKKKRTHTPQSMVGLSTYLIRNGGSN